jgi:glycosyltransferase involved in cell wall biosynthesis
MPKISVLTVFKRPHGEELVGKCLLNQSFDDWEWIQVTPLKNTMVLKNTKVIPDPPMVSGDVWGLNKAYNAGIRACSSDLIVSIQDDIWFPEDGLEKFWVYFQEYPMGCVSGVGDKYEKLDDFGKPIVKMWEDPRRGYTWGASFSKTKPNNWELNYASVPTKAMYDIGGFDETFDQYYGWDNVDVALRLWYLEYEFYLDISNESRSLMQKMPKDWEEKNARAQKSDGSMSFFDKIQNDRVKGKYPYILNYLKVR